MPTDYTGGTNNPARETAPRYSIYNTVVLMKKSKTEDAMIELRRSVQLVPSLAKAHHELANLYLQRGDLSTAYQELLLTVRYDPDER